MVPAPVVGFRILEAATRHRPCGAPQGSKGRLRTQRRRVLVVEILAGASVNCIQRRGGGRCRTSNSPANFHRTNSTKSPVGPPSCPGSRPRQHMSPEAGWGWGVGAVSGAILPRDSRAPPLPTLGRANTRQRYFFFVVALQWIPPKAPGFLKPAVLGKISTCPANVVTA